MRDRKEVLSKRENRKTDIFEGVEGFKMAGTGKKLEVTQTFRSEEMF